MKKAVETQQNVVRVNELILAGENPTTVAKDVRGNQGKRVVIWDFRLEEREGYFKQKELPKGVSFVSDGGRNVLQVVCAGKRAMAMRFFSKEEMAMMRGKKVRLTVMAKGDDIAGKGAAKFMLMVNRRGKNAAWPDANLGKGTFDWKQASFTYQMPYEATNCALVLGLQDIAGTICYRDLKVEISE